MANIGVIVKNLSSGGAEKQAVLLANALADNHAVHFIILNGENIHERYLQMIDRDKVRVHILGGSKVGRLKGLRRTFRAEDIHVAFSYLTAANCYSCLAAISSGTKVVTGLRNARLPLPKHIADCLLTNFMSARSVANCFSGKRFFSRTGFRGGKINVIPNCYPDISEPKNKESNNIPTIISVGRFVEQKDYNTAIRSMAMLKQQGIKFRYLIVGYGKLEHPIREMIRKCGVDDVVEIAIDPDNISELLDRADIYLSTSLFEGTSNSIMEAMDAQLPIVATAVGDNDHLVNDGHNGYLIPVRNPQSAADALAKLINDRQLRSAFGYRSKEILVENYSVGRFRDDYIKLIDQLR